MAKSRDPIDDAPSLIILAELAECAANWEPEVRIIGNLRSTDILRMVNSILEDYTRILDFNPYHQSIEILKELPIDSDAFKELQPKLEKWGKIWEQIKSKELESRGNRHNKPN